MEKGECMLFFVRSFDGSRADGIGEVVEIGNKMYPSTETKCINSASFLAGLPEWRRVRVNLEVLRCEG
jgi:hypothetical protein